MKHNNKYKDDLKNFKYMNSQNILIDIVWFCDFKMIFKIFKQINMKSNSIIIIIIKSKCIFLRTKIAKR